MGMRHDRVVAHDRSSRANGHTWKRSCHCYLLPVVVSAAFLAASTPLWSQNQERDLRGRVAELVRLLDASHPALRQRAQDELIRFGPAALPLLPPEGTSGLSPEQSRRVAIVRAAMAQTARLASGSATRVTLSAKTITLRDVVAEISRQTGNQIVDLRDQFGQEVTNPEIAVDWKATEFWKVMDELARKSQVGYYLYTGEPYLGLVAQVMAGSPDAVVVYAGPLRMSPVKLVETITYEANSRTCALQLEVAWEPRLRPILLELNSKDIELLDDQGRKITARSRQPAAGQQGEPPPLRIPLEKTMIRADVVLNFEPLPHDAKSIQWLRGRLSLVLPSDIQTFQFPDLLQAKNVTKHQGTLKVTLEEFKEFGEGQWAADLLLEFGSGDTEAFESYQTWFYDNEIYLQKADGTRFASNGGTTLTETQAGRVGIQYRFVDAPGRISDYRLVYKSPSSIARHSVSFEFQNLKLPRR